MQMVSSSLIVLWYAIVFSKSNILLLLHEIMNLDDRYVKTCPTQNALWQRNEISPIISHTQHI